MKKEDFKKGDTIFYLESCCSNSPVLEGVYLKKDKLIDDNGTTHYGHKIKDCDGDECFKESVFKEKDSWNVRTKKKANADAYDDHVDPLNMYH